MIDTYKKGSGSAALCVARTIGVNIGFLHRLKLIIEKFLVKSEVWIIILKWPNQFQWNDLTEKLWPVKRGWNYFSKIKMFRLDFYIFFEVPLTVKWFDSQTILLSNFDSKFTVCMIYTHFHTITMLSASQYNCMTHHNHFTVYHWQFSPLHLPSAKSLT